MRIWKEINKREMTNGQVTLYFLSQKLSSDEPAQNLDGWPLKNSQQLPKEKSWAKL